MVETSKVCRLSLPRKLSCRIHLRYTLLPAPHTQTESHTQEWLKTHSHTLAVHSKLTSNCGCFCCFPCEITTTAWHVRATSCSEQRWGGNTERQSDRSTLKGDSFFFFYHQPESTQRATMDLINVFVKSVNTHAKTATQQEKWSISHTCRATVCMDFILSYMWEQSVSDTYSVCSSSVGIIIAHRLVQS